MQIAVRLIPITIIIAMVMTMHSCESGGLPSGIRLSDPPRGEYWGTYEVIVRAGGGDELSYVWSMGIYFHTDAYDLWMIDSSGNTCEIEGTFELDFTGLLGRIELIDTALCAGWFEGPGFSAPGPRGEFETIHFARSLTMYRHDESICETIRLQRIFY